jgi:hypothetical protein
MLQPLRRRYLLSGPPVSSAADLELEIMRFLEQRR